ncbi:peroxide stress protein YaaA [Leucobacter sp. NPDC077196]|uniref:YaaA family protein n=1 Tax=Leucobacter sp. NPDC077196 TaxID=3154959 RepID=UPI0034214C6F
MLVILPPSETKRSGGAGAFDPGRLRFADELTTFRSRVRDALETLSRDEEAAAKALKLGVKNRGELAHNRQLGESGVMPAIERYTGVLYDALDVATLDASSRSWLDRHVAVQSALFGIIGAGDEIPAYRLSASSRLPDLAMPLKRLWSTAHAEIPWADAQSFVLDLRSKDYGALAPLPAGLGWSVQVAQRGPEGEMRALNHFNKAAKGDLVRRLAQSQAAIDDVDAFLAWGAEAGLELGVRADERTLMLVTDLGAPGARQLPQADAG